jgi:hypothetical protein
MSPAGDGPVAWLRHQIEGDKAAAEAAAPGPWAHDGDDDVYTVHHGEHGDLVGGTVAWARGGERESATGTHIALHDPLDVIADCEMKLAWLAEHDGVHRCDWGEHRGGEFGPCQDALRLATAYRHRPGYAHHWGSE